MRFTHGHLSNFKEIMNEFFYDWGMTSSPQIHKSEDGYWINKTSLFMEDNEYYLTYKTTTFSVAKEAYEDFVNFFNVYVQDQELEKVLNLVADQWNSHQMVKISEGFNIGEVSIVAENFKYYLKDSYGSSEINKNTYQKINFFYNQLQRI